jgi:hypothetical protein
MRGNEGSATVPISVTVFPEKRLTHIKKWHWYLALRDSQKRDCAMGQSNTGARELVSQSIHRETGKPKSCSFFRTSQFVKILIPLERGYSRAISPESEKNNFKNLIGCAIVRFATEQGIEIPIPSRKAEGRFIPVWNGEGNGGSCVPDRMPRPLLG